MRNVVYAARSLRRTPTLTVAVEERQLFAVS
jgi:hypothetical protein